MKILAGLFFVALLIATAPEARAACSSPSGVSGQISFSSGVLQFCDGSSWQSMKGSSVAGGCTSAGKFEYVADSDFKWCDGAAQWSARSATTLGACGSNGQWTWDSGSGVVKGCIGGTWYSLKNVVASGSGTLTLRYNTAYSWVVNSGAPTAPTVSGGSGNNPFTFTIPAGATITSVKVKGAGGGGAAEVYPAPNPGDGSPGLLNASIGISAGVAYNAYCGQGGAGGSVGVANRGGGWGRVSGGVGSSGVDFTNDFWAGGNGGGSSAITTAGDVDITTAAGGDGGGWGSGEGGSGGSGDGAAGGASGGSAFGTNTSPAVASDGSDGSIEIKYSM